MCVCVCVAAGVGGGRGGKERMRPVDVIVNVTESLNQQSGLGLCQCWMSDGDKSHDDRGNREGVL